MGTINKIITSQAYALTEQEKLNLLQTLAPVINAGQAASAYYFYKPEVSDEGDLSWRFTDTAGTNPQTKNIRGPKGDDGTNGKEIVLSADMTEGSETQYHLFWKYDDETSEWQDLGYIKGDTGDRGDQGPIGRTGPQGPQGPSGDPGITDITETTITETGRTGHRVTFTYGPEDNPQSMSFNVYDGNDGTMAGAPPAYGFAGISAALINDGGTNYQIGMKNFNASDNKKYAWNPFADAWQAVIEGITSVMVDTSLSGDGTTTNIGLKSTDTAKWNDAYDVAQVFKTASGGFVTSAGLVADTWYLMTTSGWKPSDVVLSEVAHDTTLSGNGRDNSPLGIAQNVNEQTFSAGFATNATNATYAQKAVYGTTEYPLGSTLKTFSDDLGTVSNDVAVLKAASGDFATSAGLTQNKTYAMTSNGWAEFTPGVATVSTDSSLSGDGNTHPLGIKKTELDNWNEAYAVAEEYKTASSHFMKTINVTQNGGLSGNGGPTAGDPSLGIDETGMTTDHMYGWKKGTGWTEVETGGDYLPLSGGNLSGALSVSATEKQIWARGTNAFQIGSTRYNNGNAIGSTWVGVNGTGSKGFIKYADNSEGGDSQRSLQINFGAVSNGYGEILLANNYSNTTTNSRIINVPEQSYTNMSAFDPTDGPNYMLRKTASGFDIGAVVINCRGSLPQNTEANAYYFVYDA